MIEREDNRDVSIEVPTGSLSLDSKNPTLWGYATFADAWFQDACAEAASPQSRDSTRREIVFAVCFLESYIFEWVRSIDLHLVAEYFPVEPRFKKDPRFRRNLKEKWKRVPRELCEDNRIQSEPNLDFSDVDTLLDYRHGLIHAAASRPFNDSTSLKHKPAPESESLNRLPSGWAIGIAADLVRQLHESTKTKTPAYLQAWLERET